MAQNRFNEAVRRIRQHEGTVTAVWGPGSQYPGLHGRKIRPDELIVAFEPDQTAHLEFLSEQRRLPADHPAKTQVIGFSKKAQDVSIPMPFADQIEMMNVVKIATGMGVSDSLKIANAHLKPGMQSHLIIGQTMMPFELPKERLEAEAEKNGFNVEYLVQGAADYEAREIRDRFFGYAQRTGKNPGDALWDALHRHQQEKGTPEHDRKKINEYMGPHAADYVLPEYYIAKLTRRAK